MINISREGWQCPRCGRIWSPDVERCDCIENNLMPLPMTRLIDLSPYITQHPLFQMIEALQRSETERCRCDELDGIQRCRSCRAAGALNDIQDMARTTLMEMEL